MAVWRRAVEARELREIGGEVVLVHDGRLLAANQVATRVWELLEEPRSEDELVAALAGEWPGAPLDRDVPGFLAQLAELGLVAQV